MIDDSVPDLSRVSPTARLLGGLGLIPQFAALVLQALNPGTEDGRILAYAYASLILSFLGGIWWGFAMRRTERQRILVVVAVIPSLIPIAVAPVVVIAGWSWALVGVATALMLTLIVDRRLADRGDVPIGWMALRVPLSGGLAILTLIAALMR